MASGNSLHPLTEKDHYASCFETLVKKGQISPPWVLPIREAAFARFVELEFPTTLHEEWKYTNIAPLVSTPFKLSHEGAPGVFTLQELEPLIYEPQWHRLVFVDGFFSRVLSSLAHASEDFEIQSLSKAVHSDKDVAKSYLAHVAGFDQNVFHALNTAFFLEGAFIQIPKGMVIEHPIHILYLTTCEGVNGMGHPRNLIVMGPESQATIIESYVSTTTEVYFTNAISEFVLNEGALLDHYKIQNESLSAFHISTMQVHMKRASSFSSFSLALGSRLSRYNLNFSLAEEGASCTLNGLYMVKGHQHVDHHTVVDHVKPHGASQQLYKGILDEKSTGVFNGKVIVQKGARGTDAHQTNKNLLLSEKALVDTKPELEIFCNDVKCTHGAAIGQLDEEAVFYLKSRGIGEGVARDLLTYGFANDVIHRVKVEHLRRALDELFISRFSRKNRPQEQEVVMP